MSDPNATPLSQHDPDLFKTTQPSISDTVTDLIQNKRPLAERSIVLVGVMGVGKSSIGRRLARHYKWPFLDADTEIETAAGCSVSEIFARYGEAAFRDGERKVLARILSGPRCILATGGGAILHAQTRALIKAQAISLWLYADLDIVVQRTSRRNTRPLLRTGNPRDILQRLLTERNPLYAEADLKVESKDQPIDETVQATIAALHQYAPTYL